MKLCWIVMLAVALGIGVRLHGNSMAQGMRQVHLPLMHHTQLGTSSPLGTLSYGVMMGMEMPYVSNDGWVIAVTSDADTLVPGDTNGNRDVFVWLARDYRWLRVSVASDGTQSNDSSEALDISEDGRYVLFRSLANNLVPGDINDSMDIFRHDLWTGRTDLVSAAVDGTPANNTSWQGSISGDGVWVAFVSSATNLSVPATFGHRIWLRHMPTGDLMLIPTADYPIDNLSMSGDARYFAYQLTELVGNNCTGPVLYRYDLTTGETREIARSLEEARYSRTYNQLILSGDGHWAGYTEATAMYPGIFTYSRLFIHLDTGEQVRVPVNSGNPAIRESHSPEGGCYNSAEAPEHGLSNDGQRVVFPAPNEYEQDQIQLLDREQGTSTIISNPVTESPPLPNGAARASTISGDGKVAVFSSRASNLLGIPDPNGNNEDLFVWRKGVPLPLPMP